MGEVSDLYDGSVRVTTPNVFHRVCRSAPNTWTLKSKTASLRQDHCVQIVIRGIYVRFFVKILTTTNQKPYFTGEKNVGVVESDLTHSLAGRLDPRGTTTSESVYGFTRMGCT